MKDHRELREQLGAYALGHLPPRNRAAVTAHLDGCAACRAELAEIAPLADDLAGVDVERVSSRVSPPPDLGERIRAAVAEERRLVDARARRRPRLDRRVLLAAAAVALLGSGALLGAGLTREPAVPVEQLALTEVAPDSPDVESAGLIAHTWGVEVVLVASGFVEGEVYRAAVRTRDGRLLPAGEFLGTGSSRLVCNLQAALLRAHATGFVVSDADGAPVLSTSL